MHGGEGRRIVGAGQHRCVESFRQLNPAFPVRLAPGHASHEDYRELGLLEQRPDPLHRSRRRARRVCRSIPRRVRDQHLLGERLLLKAHVETDVNRAAGRRTGYLVRAQHGLHRRLWRGRLVVPLRVVPDDRALVCGSVDPVDPRAPLVGVHRAGGAEYHHGGPVAPGIEDGHGGVHQPHVGVKRHRHGLIRGLAVSVGDGDRVLLVQTGNHLRILVAQVVHQTVVEPTVARSRDQRDVLEIQLAGHRRHHVAAPAHFRAADILGSMFLRSAVHAFCHCVFLSAYGMVTASLPWDGAIIIRCALHCQGAAMAPLPRSGYS